ncbi:MAG: DNA polymerase III subunit delta, partial [Clostridia bacterium]|nr:DNA polymerase III subunit delta [Clostridia bacterium]
MDRKELFKSIDRGQIYPIYCFYGPEAYVRKQAEKKLVEKLMVPGMEMMNMSVLTAPGVSQIIESCEVLPFMGERRLVIVRELGLLGKDTGTKDKGKGKEAGESRGKDRTDESDELIRYFERIPETTCLLFDAGEGFDKRKKLGKALTGFPGCVEFQLLEEAELQRWIEKTAKGMEAAIDREAGERLVFLSGRDLTALHTELLK